MSKQITREKILTNALELFSNKGYSSVTTKEIAAKAGISEMTLFRHFDTKRAVFTTVISELMYTNSFKMIEENQFSWDLKKDLLAVTHILKSSIAQNRKIIKMNLKDIDELQKNNDSFLNMPQHMKLLLVDYFTEYQSRFGGSRDPELLAITFLSSLFGLTMKFYIVDAFDTPISYDEAADFYIDLFASALDREK